LYRCREGGIRERVGGDERREYVVFLCCRKNLRPSITEEVKLI